MKTIIFLNAGHSKDDPGAVVENEKEATHNMIIRDKLIPLLERHFTVEKVPDDIDLLDSIHWVNKKANNLNDGLAFSIHCNASKGTGAETLYYAGSSYSKEIADISLKEYCKITSFKNRKSKPDTYGRHGRLGWIRDTKCWSTLLECCFIDNPKDLKKLKSNYCLVAYGIYCGICKVYKIIPLPLEKINKEKGVLRRNKLSEVFYLLQKLILILTNKK